MNNIDAQRRAVYAGPIAYHLADRPDNWVEIGTHRSDISLATKDVGDAVEEVDAYADGAVVAFYSAVEDETHFMGEFFIIHGHSVEETMADWTTGPYMHELMGRFGHND